MTRIAAAKARLLPFGLYCGLSFAYFGWRIVSHPGRLLIGTGRDPQIFVWSMAWWPHAIGSGTNPLVTHAVYAPGGINLTWATTVPGLALPLAPVTELFGPDVAYNVAALLAPALAAWTAYLLCRYLTRSTWASLVGGYLFGFSSYMLGEQLGHLHLTAIFLLPLIALVVVRYLEGSLAARGLTWRLGLLLAWQLLISTEIEVTTTFALVLSLALAFWLMPTTRPGLRTIARPLVYAYIGAAALTSPFLVYAALGYVSGSINDPALFGTDVLNLIVPNRLAGVGGSFFAGTSKHFPGDDLERSGYLGLPTLAILVAFVWRGRRTGAARFLGVATLLAVFVALGTTLRIDGHRLAPLPWDLVARLPVFDNVLPGRVMVFATLASAVAVALWTASKRGVAAVVLPALAILAIAPAVWKPDFELHPERWAFFTDGTYKCIPKGENVAIFPYGFWDESMLWQAESGFWFNMADGYLRPDPPASNLADPTIRELTYTVDNPTPAQILGLAHRQHVGRIISVTVYVHPNGNQMHRFGAMQEIGDVQVAPACGHPALTARTKLLPKWIHTGGTGHYATPVTPP